MITVTPDFSFSHRASFGNDDWKQKIKTRFDFSKKKKTLNC